MGTSQVGRNASAGAFVHSLNILVKYVRMYGFEHKRTNKGARYTGFKLRERQALDETDDQDVPF